jgi:Flp pilus assembly pilin Flp
VFVPVSPVFGRRETGTLRRRAPMLRLRELIFEEDGQDLIEYGLLAAFVSLAVIASIDAIGGSLNTTYQSFASEVEDFTP